jgi:hypothetical protein
MTIAMNLSFFSYLGVQAKLGGQENGARRSFLEIRQDRVHKNRSIERFRAVGRPAGA